MSDTTQYPALVPHTSDPSAWMQQQVGLHTPIMPLDATTAWNYTSGQDPVASSAADQRQLLITANDYSDRQRLLYHITYLSTQLQRAQLQLVEQNRTVTILQAAAQGSVVSANACLLEGNNPAEGATSSAHAGSNGQKQGGEEEEERGEEEAEEGTVTLRIASSCATAAVVAARDEEELHAALQSSLAVFDPQLAQTQINRLDSALAQVSLMREAELQQLHRAEGDVAELRAARNSLAERAEQWQTQCESLEREHGELTASLTRATLEVERLRQEEARLNRRVVGLESLTRENNLMDGVRVVMPGKGGADYTAQEGEEDEAWRHRLQGQRHEDYHYHHYYDAKVEELLVSEAVARQALLQDMFWEPMLIAFDAGLTWTGETELLRNEAVNNEEDAGGDYADYGVAPAAVAAAPPPSDADLLLLRSQQEEILDLRSRLQIAKERVRVVQVDADKWRALHAGEQRRSEQLARDHAAQLQRAYEELVQDRKAVAARLQADVEAQVRQAYRDGRDYERRQKQRRAPAAPLNGGAHKDDEQHHRPSSGGSARQQHGGTRQKPNGVSVGRNGADSSASD